MSTLAKAEDLWVSEYEGRHYVLAFIDIDGASAVYVRGRYELEAEALAILALEIDYTLDTGHLSDRWLFHELVVTRGAA